MDLRRMNATSTDDLRRVEAGELGVAEAGMGWSR